MFLLKREWHVDLGLVMDVIPRTRKKECVKRVLYLMLMRWQYEPIGS